MSEIPVVLKNLPPHVRGFACLGSDYEPIIVLNCNLSREQQEKTYIHELLHIVRGDLWNENYNEYGS